MRNGPLLCSLLVAGPLLALVACAEFPQLDSTLDDAARAAPYPDLVPLGPLLAAQAPVAATDPGRATQDRAAALRARAARLRGAVIAPAERARMQAGPDTAALR